MQQGVYNGGGGMSLEDILNIDNSGDGITVYSSDGNGGFVELGFMSDNDITDLLYNQNILINAVQIAAIQEGEAQAKERISSKGSLPTQDYKDSEEKHDYSLGNNSLLLKTKVKYREGFIENLKKIVLLYNNQYIFNQTFTIQDNNGELRSFSAQGRIYIQKKQSDMVINSISGMDPAYGKNHWAITYRNNNQNIVALLTFFSKASMSYFWHFNFTTIMKATKKRLLKQ